MNNFPIRAAVLATLTLLGTAEIHANENIIYGGIGSAKGGSSPVSSDKRPFTFGYLNISETRNSIWGFDISKEGTLLNSTYRQNKAVNQGVSYNLLLGTNLTKLESSRFDAAVILGTRQKTKSCPGSYLGYQCYANAEPDTTYAFNYGAVVTWTFSKAMIGIRATGESTQALVGLRF